MSGACRTLAKKYLVTGGAGFIGSSLVSRLVRNGHGVRVLDNRSRGRASRLTDVRDHVEFIEADVRDANAVGKAARGMDCVCHLASINGTARFYSRPELVLEVGVKGMINVIDACLSRGVGELALTSSSEVYQTPPAIPTDESAPLSVPDPLNPRYSYGGAKIVSELLALNYGRSHFRRVLVVRPHNVYGPDMGQEHVIPQLILRAAALASAQADGAIRFPIQGDGSQTRAFIHIDDFTAGFAAVLEKGEHRTVYHIGNDDEITVRRLVKLLFDHLGRDVSIVPEALPAGSPARRCPDIGRLRALGFRPRVTLSDGLAGTIDWYLANR